MSPWKRLAVPLKISLAGLRETLQGGQSFSWNATSVCSWIGVFNSKVAELKLTDGIIYWRTLPEFPVSREELLEYLWLDESYEKAVNDLPWRSDLVLGQCIHALPGLTILNQPLDEMLFYFLLSSAKSIPQIKEIGSMVCQKFGKKLTDGIWSFPGWETLSQVSESELRNLKLGYRAKYVFGVAGILKEEPTFLTHVMESSYKEAKCLLMTLPGVGAKIADCALLFGSRKTEAFPIDTWISKALDRHYRLDSFTQIQKVLFARNHFGVFCGLAQQFLFSGERLRIIKIKL